MEKDLPLPDKLRGHVGQVIAGMLSYLNSSPNYDDSHVDDCQDLLMRYLEEMDEVEESSSAMTESRLLVLSLNRLNERAGGDLIETDQREALCELIFAACEEKGIDTSEDFTEEWREW